MPAVNQSPGGCGCGTTGCTIAVTALACDGTTVVSGATVTITQGATTICSGTTGGGGGFSCDVSATGAGSYTIEVSKSGWYGSTKTITITCPGTTGVAMAIDQTHGYRVQAIGCWSLGVQGVTFAINDGTYTTDSSGYTPYFALIPGSYPWTLSKSRWVTQTGTVTAGSCSASGLPGASGVTNLALAAGYECSTCPTSADPTKDTLSLTTALGTITLTYCSSIIGWQGCGTFASANCRGCSGGVVSCSVPYFATLYPTFSGGALSITYAESTLAPAQYSSGTTLTGCPCSPAFSGGCPTPSPGDFSYQSSCTAAPAYTASGTFSGLGGLSAVLNGSWIATE